MTTLSPHFLLRPLLTPTREADGRLAFIDVAKGLGIILVVWYHTNITPNPLLNRFFMPLFFLMSGMFLRGDDGVRVFLRKKFYELVAPFVFFLALSVALEHFCYGWEHWRIRYVPYWTFEQVGNVPLWFLVTLFATSAMAYATVHYVHRGWQQWLVIAAITAIGWALGFWQIRIFYFSQSFLMFPFYIAGYLLREPIKRGYASAPALIVVAVAAVAFGEIWEVRTNIHRLYFSEWWLPSALTAAGWIVVVLDLSLLLARTAFGRLLTVVGRATLMVLGLHMLVFTPLIEFVFPTLGLFPQVKGFTTPMLVTLGMSIVVVGVCTAIGDPLRRALPWIFGPQRFFTKK